MHDSKRSGESDLVVRCDCFHIQTARSYTWNRRFPPRSRELGPSQSKVRGHCQKRIRSGLMFWSKSRTRQVVGQLLQSAEMAIAQACHEFNVVNSGKVEFQCLKERLFILGKIDCSQELEQISIIVTRVKGYPLDSIVKHEAANHEKFAESKRIDPVMA